MNKHLFRNILFSTILVNALGLSTALAGTAPDLSQLTPIGVSSVTEASTQYDTSLLGVASTAAPAPDQILKDSYSASALGHTLAGGPQNGQLFDEEASNGVLSAMRITVTSAYTISQFQLQMCKYGNPQRYLIGAIFTDSLRTDQDGKTNHQPGTMVGSWSAPVYDGNFPSNTGTNYDLCTPQTFSGVNAPVTAGTYWIVISSTGQTCSGSSYPSCTCRTSNSCSTDSSCTLNTCGGYQTNISYCVGTRSSNTYGDSHLQPGLNAWGELQTSQVNFWLYSAGDTTTGKVPSSPTNLTVSKAENGAYGAGAGGTRPDAGKAITESLPQRLRG